MVSPGSIRADSTPPLPHQRSSLPVTTDPLARTTKMAFFSAKLVIPPACCKYQAAFFRGTWVMALEL